jgi:hypothetical protein
MSLVNRSQFETHPEGLTIGTLSDVEFDENGKFGPQIKWSFDTEEVTSKNQAFRITYWTTPTINEKSNLYRLLKAFGEDPEDEYWTSFEDINGFHELLGKKVQLNVAHKKGENGVIARIDTVLPMKRRSAAPAAQEKELVGAGAGRSRPNFED